MSEHHDDVRVVIIEDHRLVAESLSDVLGGEPGLQMAGIAEDGASGIDLVARERPDVALVDYRLPDMDGIAVTSAIRDRYPATRVVMVTSMVGESTLLKAIEAGCSGYVVKSSPLDEVVAAIRTAARGESAISPSMLTKVLPRLSSGFRAAASTVTSREREVLALLAEGRTNAEIAEALVVSTNTVRNHIQNALVKLGAHTRLEAVAIAVREGVIDRE